MAKPFAVYQQPEDSAAFDSCYFGKHVPLAKIIPGLKSYEVTRSDVMGMSGKHCVYLVAALEFASMEAIGPAYDTLSELQAAYGDEVNFLHFEVYTGLPNPATEDWQLTPAMTAFGLHTEPWLYLIGADGRVAHRVEGLFTYAEIERHLLALLRR